MRSLQIQPNFQAAGIVVLASVWHLIWLVRLPLSRVLFFTEFEERMTGVWLSAFVLIPFFLFLSAMLFSRRERVFRICHPFFSVSPSLQHCHLAYVL